MGTGAFESQRSWWMNRLPQVELRRVDKLDHWGMSLLKPFSQRGART
jgi:hypothetical protein